jgi:hypothetical protein
MPTGPKGEKRPADVNAGLTWRRYARAEDGGHVMATRIVKMRRCDRSGC